MILLKTIEVSMLRIDTMFAFIAQGPEGEGVVAFREGDVWVPMVGADMERAKSLRPIAQAMATKGDITINFVKFSTRETLETFQKPV